VSFTKSVNLTALYEMRLWTTTMKANSIAFRAREKGTSPILSPERVIGKQMKRAWKNSVVAAFCVLASVSGCEEPVDKGPPQCPNYFGPPACYTDQECIDWHDGGNWYCEVIETVGANNCYTTVSNCVQRSEKHEAIENGAVVPLDEDAGSE
jgi:hypothetical protein